ncbi:four-carbon acid sugar kinase family protein [Burkholderia sp. Ac-20365]|uniref:four-carbon acid sugar kinase family protein n=1 Tax=Burkholderia sp. Ac-20365 TaxID=2703897 RepID=UPI00197C6619|nr:four-carbon acid sugar kinase family protein [Burkholderia sp. Ac-20365]MBN3766305.1 four-carbon acid sugar kinase family protein [Burkholderia sp. Ac-20365]
MSASYGFYGDDFTGATDTLAHLARAGHRTRLFLAPPTQARLDGAGPLDAIGIAGAARAMPPAAMREELARVGACFAALGVRVMHYKVCSTFDSAPETGNIATAIATLRGHAGNPFVPIVGGQPGLQRYCVFGQLFAASGDDTRAVHRIDRHPTMSRHPVTPMHEADLRLHLERQGLRDVDLIDWRAYASPIDELEAKVDAKLALGASAILFDVLRDDDLHTLGRLIESRSRRAPLLAVGASSVAQAWCAANPVPTLHESHTSPPLGRAQGPVFVLAGSLSPVTAAQIEATRSYWKVELDPLASDGDTLQFRAAPIVDMLREGRNVLAFTRRPQASTHEKQGDASRERTAHACAALLRDVVRAARPRRIGIAGGDTSSHAVQALDAWGLSYRAPLTTGVTVCRLHADEPWLDGTEVMFKGGQMGGADVLERLVTG